MSTHISVNEAAIELGVSPDTIRRWDKKGLIKSQRSEKNHRLFSTEALHNLKRKLDGQESQGLKILKKKPNGYTCIDLFAGAGGTALGLENAGFSHLLLSEIDKDACATLAANRPDWNVVRGDVAELDFSEFKGRVDLVEGGFPCQAFSYAGNKGGFGDTRGTLFYEFARAVRESEPRVAIGENVRGLLTHDEGRTFKTMIAELESIVTSTGQKYVVGHRVLRSQYLDVPQKRERLILVAVREDTYQGDFFFPEEKDYIVSLRQAIGDRPIAPGAEYPESKKEVMELVPPGGYWRDLPEQIQKKYMGASFFLGGGKTGMARRLSWDEPSLTLTCAPAQKQTERCHPEETRPLNTREYARIQTFPDSWTFTGGTSSIYKQIGNAVPVNLGYHIGEMVSKIISSSEA
jgi:DNA (cytosine-5)-methyltransferase 1